LARKSITASRDDDKIELRFPRGVDFHNMSGAAKENERESWNRRYREASHGSLHPDPFLVSAFKEYILPSFPKAGSALDVAGGVGRHAVWLARRHWHVTLIDISEVGIEKARANARDLPHLIDLRVADLKKFEAGRERYDLILVFFYLQRSIFPELVASLRPGGLLLYKTYTFDQKRFSGGPSHPMHLLRPNELLKAFAKLRTLYYRETTQDRGVAEFVGRKP
jgi:tellurite methyltransferase